MAGYNKPGRRPTNEVLFLRWATASNHGVGSEIWHMLKVADELEEPDRSHQLNCIFSNFEITEEEQEQVLRWLDARTY